MTNTTGFFLTLLYIFAVIGIGEGLRRWRGYSSGFTRKVVHIGVGMVMWLLPWLFTNPWPFVGASAAFMLINFLDWKFGFFASMTSSDRSNLGTVYFPFATLVAALVFWDRPPLMIAAIMPLTWGDGLAAVAGKRFGSKKFNLRGHVRTLEGSVTFLVASTLAVWMALWLAPGAPDFAASEALVIALTLSIATALIEAVSFWGLDNLTVTATAVLILGAL